MESDVTRDGRDLSFKQLSLLFVVQIQYCILLFTESSLPRVVVTW